MNCFSLGWVEHILIQIIVIIAVVAIIRLLIPFVLRALGVAGSVVVQAINIVLWAVVAIFVIIICFDLIECLLGSGGFFRLR